MPPNGHSGLNRRDLLAGAASALVLLPGIAGATGAFRELVARPGTAQLFKPDEARGETRIWGYDGSVPGPLLRYRKGDTVRIRLKNGLDQPTTIHWHGIRLPNAMDGVPGVTQEAVEPGETFDYAFELPDAGTYWYHTHNKTFEQMARGLYGPLIVDELDPPPVDHDLIWMLDDWRLDREHQIHTASLGHFHDLAHAGRLGNWVTVNGRDQPAVRVKSGERIRLRLINAANARVFSLDVSAFAARIVALDGHAVVPRQIDGPVDLAPAQRADLLIDLPPGPVRRLDLVALSGGERVKVASLDVAEGEGGPRSAAYSLPAAGLPEPDLAGAVTQDMLMAGGAMGRLREARFKGQMMPIRELARLRKLWAFNGEMPDDASPLLRLKRGQTVKLNFTNDTAFSHAMHLHGHHFKVLSRNGQAVSGSEWRDTELVKPQERAEAAFVADNPGKWLLHCHMLEHHAAGMGTWIEVT